MSEACVYYTEIDGNANNVEKRCEDAGGQQQQDGKQGCGQETFLPCDTAAVKNQRRWRSSLHPSDDDEEEDEYGRRLA